MIRAIIVDDEKASTDFLKELLIGSGRIEVKGCFDKPQEALEFITKNKIDVAFLETERLGLNGLELVEHMRGRCEIVFVTECSQYAVEAFRINALDYLLKPVRQERLKETIERISQKLNITIQPVKIEVKYFGRFKIMINNTEVKFRTKKAEELIAFLLEKRGKRVSRNLILDCLWGEFDGDKALINFNTTLCYVKKALLNYGIDLPIVHEDGSYRIDIQNINCDYFRLMDCKIGDKKMIYENIAYYEEFAAQYVGGYLEENNYSWAEANQLNCKEKYTQLLLDMVSYYIDSNENNKAIALMKTGFLLEPWNGKIIYSLIRLLLEEGRYSMAEEYYNFHKKVHLEGFYSEIDQSIEWLFLRHKII